MSSSSLRVIKQKKKKIRHLPGGAVADKICLSQLSLRALGSESMRVKYREAASSQDSVFDENKTSSFSSHPLPKPSQFV